MYRTIASLLVVGLCISIGCAKPQTVDRPTGTPRIDTGTDPIDPLIAHGALVLKFDLDESGEIDDVLQRVAGEGADTMFSDYAPLAALLDEPRQFEALDRQPPLYFALTARGNPQFVNALEMSTILPIEEDPQWLHSRLVVDALPDETDELAGELRETLDSDDDASNWVFRTDGDRVIADHLLALSPGTGADPQPALERLSGRAQLGSRRASAARARFARSRSSTAMYIDYRRMGTLLSILQAGPRRQDVADEFNASGGAEGLPLLARWVSTSNAAADTFGWLNRRRADYADITVEPSVRDDRFAARLTTTRTDTGAASRNSSTERGTPVADHPDTDRVFRLEATASGETRANRRAERWLADTDSVDDVQQWIERYTDPSPWLLLSRPAAGLSGLLGFHQWTDDIRSVRLSVYEDDSEEYRLLLSAAVDGSSTSLSRLRRVIERTLDGGFEWQLDERDGRLLLRAAWGGQLEELLPGDGSRSVPEDFSVRGRAGTMEHWRQQSGIDAFYGIPLELLSLLEEDFQFHTTHRDAYAEAVVGNSLPSDRRADRLPDAPVRTSDSFPSCALDVSTMIDRLVDDFQQTSPATPNRSQVLLRRAVPIIDRARQCERDYPQTPRFSRVLGRNLWSLGIREEGAGRLDRAAEFYQQGCDLEEPLSCRYLLRIRRAAGIDIPRSTYDLRSGRSSTRFSGFVANYISIDHMDRVSAGERGVGLVEELQHEERIRGRVGDRIDSDQLLPTPLGLVGAHDELYHQALHTLGLAADADVDTLAILDGLTAYPLSENLNFQAYLRAPDAGDAPRISTTAFNVRRADVHTARRGQKGRISVHLRDDGIQVLVGNKPVPSLLGCRQRGPTVCLDRRGPDDEMLPVDGLLSVMPNIVGWRRATMPVTVIVDTDLRWAEFAQVVALLQDSNHPAWKPVSVQAIRLFSPRFGVPHQQVEVVIDGS